MKALLATAAAALLVGSTATSATTVLQPNDIQIVGFASDAPDALAFVTWVNLDPGTEIRFTDNGWDCAGFRLGESDLVFTAPIGGVSAGSVVEYVDDVVGGGQEAWTLPTGSFSLTGSGDQIIVYQGTLSSPTPIFAFDTTDGWEECGDVNDSYTSALPTGLVDGVSAVTFVHSDTFWYRPWYSKSAMLETLKEWMVDRNRFKTTSTATTRVADYEVPTDEGFTILTGGQRGGNGYTEYIPGTAACIILTGHDGDIYPDDITDRNHGCLVVDGDDGSTSCDWSKTCAPQDSNNCDAVTANDENTQDMARRANDYFTAYTGGIQSCHLIVNRLGRIKLDPNRQEGEAAQFDQTALDTYDDFHAFVTMARGEIENNHPCGAGLLIDFHGHIHPEARIEMGYKLNADQLRESDGIVDGLGDTSSVKNMPTHKSELLSSIIRGSTSMGAFFELPTANNATGYLSVPSPTVTAPALTESYFEGGYNILTHGSQTNGGTIDAIQIEFPRYLRAQEFGMQTDVLRAFGEVVVPQMLAAHYPAACDPFATPTTPSPVTPAPITPAPVTAAPVTPSPVTPAPVTPAPTATPTAAPVTPAPVTPAPVTSAPITPAPVTSAPAPAPAPEAGLVAYDMVNSASHGLTSYTNDFTGAFTSSWDGFQKYRRGSGFIPPYLRDDGNDPNMASVIMDGTDNGQCCGFFHKYGIVNYSDTDEFFGIVDTDGANTQSTNGVGTATWQFDIAGHTNLDVSIAMAAIGNFESSSSSGDYLTWTASIDGGSAVALFHSTVDIATSHVYTLSDGTTKTFDDPIKVDGAILDNHFTTFTKSLASVVNLAPVTGNTLTLQLEAKANSPFEVIAFRSIKIHGSPAPAPSCGIASGASGCTSHSQCCSNFCKGNGKCK